MALDWNKWILGSVVLILNYYAEQYKKENSANFFTVNSTDYLLPHVKTYDFIIVGGGIGGCVLANRLSKNPNMTVLLLEAGGNPPPQIEIPGFSFNIRLAKSLVFDFYSVPQKGANYSKIAATVGKVLGGTTNLNLQMYNRGHPRDFDHWAKITGDNSWRYDQVLQHFISVENYQGEFPLNGQHGREGPLVVSKQTYAPGRSIWLAAGREKGYSVSDPSGPQQISFTPVEYSKVNGRRETSYGQFVKPIEALRKNLKVERYAEVTEILFDENNRANAVTYKKHGVYRGVQAKKEIIICAGSYNTPKLLMLSGIGPKNLLDNVNITTRVDLPVGHNLQDHPKTILKFFVKDKSIVFDPNRDLDQRSVDNFERNGKGPLTSTLGLAGQCFILSSVATSANETDWPDLQLAIYSQNVYFLFPDPGPENETAVYIIYYLSRPKSRGWVTLNTTNIMDSPVIDFNYFDDPRDMQTLIDGFKSTLSIFEDTKAYKDVGASYPTKPLPACSHLPFRTDPYFDCYIRNVLASGNHPSGTCRMGRDSSDPKAVVDSKLRVIGVNGLRVVDGSIMPFVSNSNIQAVIYMIAEKTSKEIKNTWNL